MSDSHLQLIVGVSREYSIGLAIPENALKILPVIKSNDLQRSLHFYTEVLDFERKWPGHENREMANAVSEV